MPMVKVLTVSSLRSSVFGLLPATSYHRTYAHRHYQLPATSYRLDCRAMSQRALQRRTAWIRYGRRVGRQDSGRTARARRSPAADPRVQSRRRSQARAVDAVHRHLDRRLRQVLAVGARRRRRGRRRREPGARVGEPRDRARVLGGDGEQDAAGGSRSGAAEGGRHARRGAAVRGGGRRRRAADSRRPRRPGGRPADRRRRHSQRHVQLHPQPDVGDATRRWRSCLPTRSASATRKPIRAPTSMATTPRPSWSCSSASRSGGISSWRRCRGDRFGR